MNMCLHKLASPGYSVCNDKKIDKKLEVLKEINNCFIVLDAICFLLSSGKLCIILIVI